jgi:prepilin-type processing-associated H-X9-DG protein
VVAIIALLISILLPSLSQAREQGKKAVCLSNMRSVAQGNNAYSSEDEIENAIPIHQQTVAANAVLIQGGLPDNWAYRTIMPAAFGGRTAQVPFIGNNAVMNKNGRWAAKTRPLNQYLYDLEGSDENKLPLYHCPSDKGYPDNPYIYDAPYAQISDIPCYDILGNSYRFSITGISFLPYGSGAVAVAPYGHRLSTLENTARFAAIMEPIFYSMTIQAAIGPLPAELLLRGWHGETLVSNVGFVDGSARTTKASELDVFDAETLRKMNVNYNADSFLRRGFSWQMDCYPTPAAWIAKYNASGQPALNPGTILNQGAYTGWPFLGYQDNMRPPQ